MLASTNFIVSFKICSLNKYYGAFESSRISIKSIIASFFYSLNSYCFLESEKSANL